MGPAFKGILASLGSSVVFGAIFFLAPTLAPLDAHQLLAWRLVATIPAVALALTLLGRWDDVVGVLRRLRSRPQLIPVLLVDSMLLGVQLWLFGWGPQTGHGLDLALGFLLLPMVMVLVGILVHRERLSGLRGAAILCALAGVGASLFLAGGMGWATIVVATGYPIYFLLRQRFALNTIGATSLEFGAMAPYAIFMLCQEGTVEPVLTDPRFALLVALLGLLSAVGFLSYLQASRMLSFGLFGLLGYLEPLLLIGVSVGLLHEPFAPGDAIVYAPILLALLLLACEGLRTRVRAPAPGQVASEPERTRGVPRARR